VASAPRR